MGLLHHEHHEGSSADRLATAGLRGTRQRLAVYDALEAARSHPTADELHALLVEQEPDRAVSLATVYNTLEAFCRVGLAQKLPGRHGSTRYDIPRNQHLHLKDRLTGDITDVPDHLSQAILSRLSPQALAEIERDLGFRIERIELNLVGQAD
ncbi:MAG: transcriptional repressor [Planctomycetota bacterium]